MEQCFLNRPSWNPQLWNNLDDKDLLITNCYSYAMNIIEKNKDPENNNHKIQPGEISNSKLDNNSCENIIQNIQKDFNFNLNPIGLYDILPCNHYRIAIVLDEKGDYRDYHLYRQDNDGLWSHKQGKGKIKRYDASNNHIKDPKTADRNYSTDDKNKDKYNYETFCGYFSVPYNGGPFYR
tara:strand:- start:2346 stop:2885 length:540 start_codon:yes stop_codon:yes gene_type:complete